MKASLLDIFVTMEPVAKQRPRMTRAGHTYTPSKTKQAEWGIAQAVGEAWPKPPLEEALEFVVVAYIYSPKHPKCKEFPVTRPDGDNYLKLCCDALNKVLWTDDSYLVNQFVYKRFVDEAHPHPGFRLILRKAVRQESEDF